MTKYNPFDIAGKTILITGASSGIGAMTALECSKMGANVIICGRDQERLNLIFDNLASGNHKKIVADLTIESDLENLITKSDYIDGLVLSAGISLILPVKFSDTKNFEKLFQVNFFSQIELLRRFYKNKKLKNDSSVVFIASVGGTTSFNVGNGIYGSAKAALISYSKFCAKEMAARNIRVNCVSPSMIETPLIRNNKIINEQLLAYKDRYILKRFGRSEEVAWGVIYLLSNASTFITGSDLKIDGGNI